MVSEMIIQSYRYIKDDPNWILSSMALSILMCGFFIVTLFYSLRKYVKLKPAENLIQSIQTALYIIILWFPLAVFIIFKIIFMKNTMNWDKTAHGSSKYNINLQENAEQKTEKEKAETLLKI